MRQLVDSKWNIQPGSQAGIVFKVGIKLPVIYHHQMRLGYSLMLLTVIKWTHKMEKRAL